MMQRIRQLTIAAIVLINAALLMVVLLRHTGGTYRIPAIHIDLDTIPTVGELFRGHLKGHGGRKGHPVYKPDPDWLPPIVKDPSEFLLSDDGTPPDIPSYNIPERELWRKHGLEVAPPLLIGFTRSWPILVQAVVSYITAGWPPEMIYVVENTGVQQANARGQLTLQNPLFCNHTILKALGVNVVTTPALLTFAQLQNYYLSLTYQHNWPYYFWSHMDVLVLSHEEGLPDFSPKATEEGYKSMYTLAIEELGRTMAAEKEWRAHRSEQEQKSAEEAEERKNSHDGGIWERRRGANADGDEDQHEGKWATRFFAYDLLTLMNPRAVEDVGGWDSMISYYYTDCDFYSRLWMRGWGNKDVNVGIIQDVNTALDDLRALYRVPGVQATWTDPNPPPPGQIGKRGAGRHWQAASTRQSADIDDEEGKEAEEKGTANHIMGRDEAAPFEDWRRLRDVSNRMLSYKQASHNNRARGRNTWQLGQHGGHGEPFFYDMAGIQESIDVMTDAGKEVYRRKWAKTDCDLIASGRLGFQDQWRVSRIQYD